MGGGIVKPLEPGASREDVIAAVEAQERREREHVRHEYPPVPDGFEGCVTSLDGQAIACYGPVYEDPSLIRQQIAGEEDQSVPGWDSGT